LKICFLSSMHPLRDKRVFDKEAISLAQAGFEVIHIAPGEGEDLGQACESGVQFIGYKAPEGIAGRLLRLLDLYRRAARVRADCYHCNEVDSWLVGALLKLRKHRRLLLFDAHEHYSSRFDAYEMPSCMARLGGWMVKWLFRLLLPSTDLVVLAKASVASEFSAYEHKCVLVRNFTLLAHMQQETAEHNASAAECSSGMVTVCHLGLISRIRGWPQLLSAMSRCRSEKLRLHIIGTFNDNSQRDFEEHAQRLQLAGRICIEGWQPFAQAYAKLRASQIGLILFQPGLVNHVYALPHKMFDYMMAGLPLIAPAFAEEVAAIVREADCGVILDSSDPNEIAHALDHLAAHPEERKRMGENGRRAVIERYNWESEARRLISAYRELEAKTV